MTIAEFRNQLRVTEFSHANFLKTQRTAQAMGTIGMLIHAEWAAHNYSSDEGCEIASRCLGNGEKKHSELAMTLLTCLLDQAEDPQWRL